MLKNESLSQAPEAAAGYSALTGFAPLDTLYEIYKEAVFIYQRELFERQSSFPLRYLQNRGVSVETIRRFGIGYAPNGYGFLYKKLREKFCLEDLLASNLIRISKRGYPCDFFYNRIMFPVTDATGNVVAFGGRTLSRDEYVPKYLNTAESEFFKKRETLYGYPSGTESHTLLICEGYMDLIALKEAGFSDSCAILGTALTEFHTSRIAASYKEVILCLDSDAPGIRAARRSVPVLKRAGVTVSFLDLTPSKDPDEFLKSFGKELFLDRMEEKLPADYFLARYGDVSDLVDVLVEYV